MSCYPFFPLLSWNHITGCLEFFGFYGMHMLIYSRGLVTQLFIGQIFLKHLVVPTPLLDSRDTIVNWTMSLPSWSLWSGMWHILDNHVNTCSVPTMISAMMGRPLVIHADHAGMGLRKWALVRKVKECFPKKVMLEPKPEG